MELQTIKHLLDSYLAGETNIDEEDQLRDYFLHAENIPESWQPYKAMFAFFESEQGRRYQGDVYLPKKRPYKLWIGSAAVAVCLLVLLVLNPFKNNAPTETNTQNFNQNTKGLFMIMGSAVKESKQNFSYLNELDTLKTVDHSNQSKPDKK